MPIVRRRRTPSTVAEQLIEVLRQAIQGLYDAQRSGAPVLAIAAHIPSPEIGTGFFQETHPERVFVDCSGFCETVGRAEQMPRIARVAIQRALGDGAVSVLILSGDVADLEPTAETGTGGFVEERAVATPAR